MFISDTRSMDWKTMGMFNYGLVFLPVVLYYMIGLISKSPAEVFDFVMDVWISKPLWRLTNSYPYKVAVWGLLDVLKVNPFYRFCIYFLCSVLYLLFNHFMRQSICSPIFSLYFSLV